MSFFDDGSFEFQEKTGFSNSTMRGSWTYFARLPDRLEVLLFKGPETRAFRSGIAIRYSCGASIAVWVLSMDSRACVSTVTARRSSSEGVRMHCGFRMLVCREPLKVRVGRLEVDRAAAAPKANQVVGPLIGLEPLKRPVEI